MENLALIWIRSQDRPARSQSLYRLSYTAHIFGVVRVKFMVKERDIAQGFFMSYLAVSLTNHHFASAL